MLGVDVKTVSRWALNGKLQAFAALPGRTGARMFLRVEVAALASSRHNIAASPSSPPSTESCARGDGERSPSLRDLSTRTMPPPKPLRSALLGGATARAKPTRRGSGRAAKERP